MLEKHLFNAETKASFPKIFLETLALIFFLSILNIYMGGTSFFLTAMISLTLTYPITKYLRSRSREELTEKLEEFAIMKRHELELIIFWSFFIACVFGLYLVSPLISDYTMHDKLVDSISGNITSEELGLSAILSNNLSLLALTFFACFISTSILVFILVWNASIVSHVLVKVNSHNQAFWHSIGFLSHGLLEIGGYILIGIAGSILAYRIEWRTRYHKVRWILLKDILTLIFVSIFLVVIGALIEVV